MPSQVTVLAAFRPLEPHRDDFLALMRTMIEHTRKEPGCAAYDLYTDGDGGYHLFEIYSGSEALQAHRDTAHYRHFRANVTDILDGDVDVLVLSGIDTER